LNNRPGHPSTTDSCDPTIGCTHQCNAGPTDPCCSNAACSGGPVCAWLLVSIAVTSVNPSVVKGKTQQFAATGTFSDNTTQDLTASAQWSSSDMAVATISTKAGSNGLAAALAAGSTMITTTLADISGSTTLTVTSCLIATASLGTEITEKIFVLQRFRDTY
jgi:hypothetical protein